MHDGMVVPQFEAQWPRTTATEQVGGANGTCSLQSNAKSVTPTRAGCTALAGAFAESRGNSGVGTGRSHGP